MVVTSNGGSDPIVWAIASTGTGSVPGILYAYDGNLNLLWCSASAWSPCEFSSAFTPESFALPTVVNGNVYVPTAGIASPGSGCSSTSQCSGVLVYVHKSLE